MRDRINTWAQIYGRTVNSDILESGNRAMNVSTFVLVSATVHIFCLLLLLLVDQRLHFSCMHINGECKQMLCSMRTVLVLCTYLTLFLYQSSSSSSSIECMCASAWFLCNVYIHFCVVLHFGRKKPNSKWHEMWARSRACDLEKEIFQAKSFRMPMTISHSGYFSRFIIILL